MKRLSIVVPCYNEEEAIPLFYAACSAEVAKLPVETEWWFVDDGSRDGTLAALKALRAQDYRAHYISFSRNFGKESGMFAGLEAAKGAFSLVGAILAGTTGAMFGNIFFVTVPATIITSD